VYFPKCQEWAELTDEQIERVNKEGYVPKKNKEFIDRVSRLKITLVT
jgi:hypothetical protein